jgi:hypothetical protein
MANIESAPFEPEGPQTPETLRALLGQIPAGVLSDAEIDKFSKLWVRNYGFDQKGGELTPQELEEFEDLVSRAFPGAPKGKE